MLTPEERKKRLSLAGKKGGALGGKARVPKGFATMDKDRLIEVSRIGGSKSKRVV